MPRNPQGQYQSYTEQPMEEEVSGKKNRGWVIPVAVVALLAGAVGIVAWQVVSNRSSSDESSGTAAGSSSSQGEEVGTGLNAPGAWDVVDDGDDFGGDYLGSDLPPLTTPVASAPAPALGPVAEPEPVIKEQKSVHHLTMNWTVDTELFEYPFSQILGDTFLFYEAQRSGNISNAPGGNRINWRDDQLLDDGQDVDMDLSGGSYEAGNRLKVTLASGYYTARLAMSCSLFRDAYKNITYDGKSMLHWCEREVGWATDWLLKTYVPGNGTQVGKWGANDKFVAMVGTVPDDWQCYRRAEVIPIDNKNCTVVGRTTLVADSTNGAADAASEASAALATAAVLLGPKDPAFAKKALDTAHALHDYATLYPVGLKEWAQAPNMTYPTTNPYQGIYWASAALAWAHTCGDLDSNVTCDPALAEGYVQNASYWWAQGDVVTRRTYYPVSNWDNPVFDASLLMTLTTGSLTGKFAADVHQLMSQYIIASGNIAATPKGLRTYATERWASLRMAVTASALAVAYASLEGQDPGTAMHCRCLARSQVRYVVGDTGFSYVAGFGEAFPQQIHHRDAACTLAEDKAGDCGGENGKPRAFDRNRPNPHVITGAMVGGPNIIDVYRDFRNEFHYTEVALDYNAGLTTALAGLIAAPPAFWAQNCTEYLPKYPW